jgi:hypothetical protein
VKRRCLERWCKLVIIDKQKITKRRGPKRGEDDVGKWRMLL